MSQKIKIKHKYKWIAYKSLLNNLHIRHNNVEGDDYKKLTAEMPSNELEEWYDRTYDLMLLALMYANYLDYKPEIKDLRLIFKGSNIK